MDAPAVEANMPRGVRAALWVAAGMIGGGALYLIAVRGTAILFDIGQLGAMLFCL
jgi:hypothetical protein